MSVPSWKRKESSTEYLWQIYQLNIAISEITANKPKKYKDTYHDMLIKTALKALTEANIANDIYVTNEEEYMLRRNHLLEARGQIYNVALIGDMFLEICKKSPYCDVDKCTRQQERIGNHCSTCLKLINGVIKADKQRYKP